MTQEELPEVEDREPVDPNPPDVKTDEVEE